MAKKKTAVSKKGPASVIEAKVKALIHMQEKITTANNVLKGLKEQEEGIERELLEAMQTEKLTSVATKQATAFITNRTFTSVSPEGFDEFFAYVVKHKAADLIHKRVNQRAYLDRLENKEVVPGVVKVEIPTVGLRRK